MFSTQNTYKHLENYWKTLNVYILVNAENTEKNIYKVVCELIHEDQALVDNTIHIGYA